jgi:hypothetical protein
MIRKHIRTSVFVAILWCIASLSSAQTTAAAVPPLVKFSGVLSDVEGKPMTGVIGVTFYLYKDAQGGAPVWMETQNVRPDRLGNYSAMLGSTTSAGIPAELFTSGEARWLGVQAQGQAEQPRVLLISVPYAMKAADAETIGGLPPSAFMRATPGASGTTVVNMASSDAALPPASLTGTGTANFVPLWTSSSALANSVLFQTGSGSTAKIGIGNTAPSATLDVTGAATIRGLLNLPNSANATATAGAISRPLGLVASTFNSSTHAASNQVFHWQAEPVGNNTTAPSATLNLLFATAPAAAAETGLKINSKGVITFASGQTFPGTGNGTITGVTAGTDLTGGGKSGSVTLNLDTSKVPQLNASNTFVGSQTITGDVDASGAVEGQSAQFGVFGSPSEAPTVSVDNQGSGEGIAAFSTNGAGISAESENYYAVMGLSSSAGFAGIFGQADVSGSYAIYATQEADAGQALWAENSGGGAANGAGPDAVHGVSHGSGGAGVAGINDASGGIGVYGRQLVSGSYAGRFDGDVWVNGNLSKNGGSFKIDHPLDPSNKYLYHSFVESPDMKNIYDGVASLDAAGEAVVSMPEWFGALNRDFRYQLTCIGGFAPVYIAEEITNNQFKIGGGKPGMKVSWQVTGTRQDAWANAHRIPVEEVKPEDEHGTYLHPELFGAPEQLAVGWGRYRFSDKAHPHKAVVRHAPANRRTVRPGPTATNH